MLYDHDKLRVFESTGLKGDSRIRTYQFDDAKKEVVNIKELFVNPETEFGEGFTRFGDKFYQLTYHNGVVNVFHEENPGVDGNKLVLEKKSMIPRDSNCKIPEGWGLTNDDNYLYMTDGSNRIFRFKPTSLLDYNNEEVSKSYKEGECAENSKFDRTFFITDPQTGKELKNLNELELVGNYLYANIWDPYTKTNKVVKIKIDGESMSVVKTYDF